jgi:protocatechuate 3,4-dioxygenase beta subunit
MRYEKIMNFPLIREHLNLTLVKGYDTRKGCGYRFRKEPIFKSKYGEVPENMYKRTTTLTTLVLSLLLTLGVFGCTSGTSPVAPGSDINAGMSNDTSSPSDDGRTAADGTFSGTITDNDGTPIAGADLYVDGELAGWTEDDGSFEIYGMEDGVEFKVEAKIDGNVVYTTTVNEISRGAQSFGDNDPNIPRGTVYGFVHDQDGPVAHALVIVFNATENFGADFTNELGLYNIDNAPAGAGTVIAFAPQHFPAVDGVVVIPDGEVQKNLFLAKKMEFGRVGGRVVTGPLANLKPVPHADVAIKPAGTDLEPHHTFTNKHGMYLFPQVGLGPHAMNATAPCFNMQPKLVDVHPGNNFVGFHLEPTDCGGVEGRVLDVNGDGIAHAMVQVVKFNEDNDVQWVRWDISGPNGYYKIAPVPPGQYGMRAHKPGYEPWNGGVAIFPDQLTVKDITLIVDPDWEPPGDGNGPPPPPPPPGDGGGGGNG